jgi:hypothetical protein
MTTTDGYIRQISFVLNDDQHVVHNYPAVATLLRDCRSRMEEQNKSVAFWLERCAAFEKALQSIRDGNGKWRTCEVGCPNIAADALDHKP